MTMGDIAAQSRFLDADDLLFMESQRSLKDLTSTPSTSSGEVESCFLFSVAHVPQKYSKLKSSRHESQEETFTEQPPVKKSRVEDAEPSFSSSFNDFADIFDGLDLPQSVVERRTDIEKPGEPEKQAEDCHDFYGQIQWCDEIIAKFEAQLNNADDETERAIQEASEEATKLIEQHKAEKEQEKLMKKTALKHDKLNRKILSQANKEKPLFCCFICNKGFTSEESVQQHVNETHLRLDKRYPYKCKHCHMRFAHMPNLYRHMNTHSGTGFKCPHCPYDFKQEASLEIHINRDHAPKSKELSVVVNCDICKNTFSSKAELKRHSYYCKNKEEIAQKRKEKKKAQLSMTQQVVSPALSTCSVSSMSTTTSTESCGRPTKDKSCPYCLDVFASMQSRNRHIGRKHPERVNDAETTQVVYFKVDSPDLPYACQECGKRFATSASLQTHKKRIHEKRLDFVCEKCSKAYPLGSELRKHLRRVHNVTELEAQDITSF